MAKKKGKSSSKSISKKKLQKESVFSAGKVFHPLAGLAIIFVLGSIIYSNSFSGAFHFDDLNNIVNNAKLRNLSDVNGIWRMSGQRFLAYFSFAVNYHYGELNVWGYHFVNLLIHLINASLVWWLTSLLFKTPVLKTHRLARYSMEIGFFTALLFVSHPLATMSVTYIVQRMASMVAMFYFLTIACYLKGRMAAGQTPKRYAYLIAALVFALMAMMTKENAFTLPIAIVLIEICFLQTKKISVSIKDYRVLLGLGAIVLLAVIVLTKFSLSIFDPIPPGIDHPYTITPLNYLFTQFSVLVKYLQLLLVPVNLNVDYDYGLVENFFNLKTVLSFLFLVGLVIAALRSFAHHRIITFGVFWFFITIAIESSIVPILDVIFEHRTYLPSLGFFLILVTYIYYFFRERNKSLGIGILVLMIGINSFLTYQRNKVWKDESTLLGDVIKKSPNKPRPYVNLGSVHMDRGEWDKAAGYFSRAIDLKPDYVDAYNNRGAAYTNMGQLDLALADYTQAIEINPSFTEAYYNRGITHMNLNQWDKAIADYTTLINLDPGNAQFYFSRGNCYMQLRQYDQSLSDYDQAIKLNPTIPSVFINRGYVYGQLNRTADAIADYTSALAIQPDLLSALEKRALSLAGIGKWNEANADFSKMIEINSQNANYFYNRGYSYENLGQPENALADYDRALAIDPNMERAKSARNFVLSRIRSTGN